MTPPSLLGSPPPRSLRPGWGGVAPAPPAHWARGGACASPAQGRPDRIGAPPEGGEAGAPGAEFTLVHGTLRWPLWEYLYSYEAARAHLERQETPFSLVGHTHVPLLVAEGGEVGAGG